MRCGAVTSSGVVRRASAVEAFESEFVHVLQRAAGFGKIICGVRDWLKGEGGSWRGMQWGSFARAASSRSGILIL